MDKICFCKENYLKKERCCSNCIQKNKLYQQWIISIDIIKSIYGSIFDEFHQIYLLIQTFLEYLSDPSSFLSHSSIKFTEEKEKIDFKTIFSQTIESEIISKHGALKFCLEFINFVFFPNSFILNNFRWNHSTKFDIKRKFWDYLKNTVFDFDQESFFDSLMYNFGNEEITFVSMDHIKWIHKMFCVKLEIKPLSW